MVNEIKQNICRAINELYGDILKEKFVTDSDLFELIGDGVVDGDIKFSRHIIVKPSSLYCNNTETIKLIAQRAIELTRKEYKSAIDTAVYRENGSLRFGLTKKGNREMRLPAEYNYCMSK